MMAQLLSVNVGLPHEVEWKGRIVRTAIWKYPVQGRCRVRRLNLDGDGQADLAGLKRATYPPFGPAAPAFAITVRPVWFQGQ